MRRKYSIGLAGLLLAGAALAAPCPPEITEIAARVAALREVSGPFAPPCRLIPPGDLSAVLDRKLRRDLPVAPDVFLQALSRLGFIADASPAVYDRLLQFYSSQVLGFYEPQADELEVVSTPAAAKVEGTLVWAHELAHAAQEHRFHLPSRLLAMRGDSDEQRAASAIAEGEAMLVMFQLNTPGTSAEALAALESTVRQQARALAPPGVPPYFVADLVFPYTVGFATVVHAFRSGGWPAVDGLLAKPPPTTAALLHPDRPAISGAVPPGELPAAPPGWETVLTDTVGEWGIAYLLGQRMDEAEAARVAAAWDGDRLRLIRSRSHPEVWALTWRMRARSVEERTSLEAALERHLPALLVRLAPADQLRITWVTAGRTLEVRAAWPAPSPPPGSPS